MPVPFPLTAVVSAADGTAEGWEVSIAASPFTWPGLA